MNKASVTRENLLEINPEAEVLDLPAFLDQEDLARWVPRADFVVNTIDFDSESFRHCSELCRKHGKVELFPTNLGFGGSVLVCPPTSPTFSKFFKTEDHVVLKKKILDFLVGDKRVPFYMGEAYAEYQRSSSGLPDPQLGIGVSVTSALAVTAMVQIMAGKAVRMFPQDFYYADCLSSNRLEILKE